MNLFEASKYFGDYRQLLDENREMLSENVEAMVVPADNVNKFSLVPRPESFYNSLSDRETIRIF